MKLVTKAFSEAMEEKYGDPNAFAIAHATGCMEVVSSVFPYTAWRAPWLHVAFENAAAAASGVEAAWKKLGRKGKILTFGGDGGTADIGLQALSGMLERRQNVVYVMYDNEAYMNTGIQRSSSTPYGAWTTTSPPGKYSIGEDKPKKWVALIAAAHQIPYAATASIGNPFDLVRKVKKAAKVDGPAFVQMQCTCPTGWKSPLEKGVEIARLAIETGIWPLFEIENGDFHHIKIQPPGGGAKVTREGGKIVAIEFRKPIEEYLKYQGRFKHLFKQPEAIDVMREQIKAMWKVLGVEVTLPKPEK
jgi:pyruvate ferredoxin oxidoreductase beta subunit